MSLNRSLVNGKIRSFQLASGLFIVLAALSVHANLTVYPMVATVDGQSEATTVQVFSKSAQTQYVKATVKRIVHPATPQEREEIVNDADGLVISPQKFALPAGGNRKVRLISMNTPAREETWRVYFEPVPSLNNDGKPEADKTKVNVNLVWGVLVRILPSKPAPSLTLSHDGRVLLNNGNLRLFVIRVARCTPVCKWQPINRSIYPSEQMPLLGNTSSKTFRLEYTEGRSTASRTVVLAVGETISLVTQ